MTLFKQMNSYDPVSLRWIICIYVFISISRSASFLFKKSHSIPLCTQVRTQPSFPLHLSTALVSVCFITHGARWALQPYIKHVVEGFGRICSHHWNCRVKGHWQYIWLTLPNLLPKIEATFTPTSGDSGHPCPVPCVLSDGQRQGALENRTQAPRPPQAGGPTTALLTCFWTSHQLSWGQTPGLPFSAHLGAELLNAAWLGEGTIRLTCLQRLRLFSTMWYLI